MRRLFTLLLISMLPILAMGQNGTVYPIDLSVMMTPPYGTCLKEYVGSDRIVVQALLKDFSKKSEQFVVQLKVTDNRNRVVLLTNFGGYDFPAGKTFTYPMGPNADQGDKNNVLHQLFENAKIQPKNECFEEGAYTFEFQAFQAASYPSRKIALSMPFRYPVFLQGNTVQPLQIYPYENEVICSHAFEYTNENGIKRNATQLGGIAYQWQSANPTGMRVGYLLQVVDLGLIGDKKWSDIKSEAGGIFGRVDKESYRVNELTYAPFYNHAFSAGNYEENHAYAWRVLALVGKDLELGKNASVNDNNAPVRVFYFCGAPGIEKDDYEVIKDDREFDKNLHKVKMDTVKSTDLNALALWRDSSVKDAYCGVNVEIRKKGQEKWTPYFVEQTNKYDESIDPTDNSYTFTNLSYNTRYEVRAQYVKCENCAQRPTGCVYAPYSDILEFVIAQPIDSATCGQNLPKLADCGDGVKAPRILAGDTIIANGTKVVVDSVSYPNASDSSIISGKGHICMPIVKNIQLKMEFNEITINCAKELVKGKVVSVWDDKTCAMIDIDELGGQNSTGGTDNTASDATVEEYDPSTANDKPAGTLMVDKDGTVKFKTKDGKIEDIGKSITLSAQEYQSKDFLSDNAHYIEFYNEDKNNAFDNNAQGYYDKISKYEYFDSPLNKVVLPWLANNPGKIKKIKAREVKKKETIASFESVMFVIPSGDSYIQLDAKQDKDGNYDLQIPGWADVDYSTPIYAIARNSAESSYFDAGKMMQANYAERTHKLNIVSLVGDLDASYKTAVEKSLKDIYGRLGISWTVEVTKLDNDTIKNVILDDGLSITADDESSWKSETREMRTIRKLYQHSVTTIDKDAAYLFVVNHPEEKNFNGVEGDMPRSQSVGYIFKDNVTDASKFGRLVAHEIGHGVYKLQHTFDYDGLKDKKEQTDNLMDYNGGDFLAHYQWRVMQDSVMFVWGLFQDDEDGFAFDKTYSAFCFDDSDLSEALKEDLRYFYLPDGRIVDLSKTSNLVCGFYDEKDSYPDARGAIFCFDIDSYRGYHVYADGTKNTLGYGLKNNKTVLPCNAILADNQNVEAYRVFKTDDGLLVKSSKGKVLTIHVKLKTCNCKSKILRLSPSFLNSNSFVFYNPYSYYKENNMGKNMYYMGKNYFLPISDYYEEKGKNQKNVGFYYREYNNKKDLLDELEACEKYKDAYGEKDYRDERKNVFEAAHNSYNGYPLNSPFSMTAIKDEHVKTSVFNVKNAFEKMKPWVDKNWQMTSVTGNPKSNRQRFYKASTIGNELDIASYNNELKDNVLYEVYYDAANGVNGKTVFYNSEEIRYVCYGYIMAYMNLSAYEAAFSAFNFFDKEYSSDPYDWVNETNYNSITVPFLLKAMYDGYYYYGNRMFQSNFVPESFGMYTLYDEKMLLVDLDYDLSDLAIDFIFLYGTGYSAQSAKGAIKVVGKFTIGMLADALLQVGFMMMADETLTFKEAFYKIEWDKVVNSGIENLYPNWLSASYLGCLRTLLKTLDNDDRNFWKAAETCMNSFLSNSIARFATKKIWMINNVDINLRIIFERNLRYHTRHFLQQLASYGFNRDTLEWFVSDIVGKKFFSDYKHELDYIHFNEE